MWDILVWLKSSPVRNESAWQEWYTLQFLVTLCITVCLISTASNYFYCERITHRYLLKDVISTCLVLIKMFMRLVLRSFSLETSSPYVYALLSAPSPPAVNLIKVMYQASAEGLPQFKAILHGSRWTISLTAELHSSGKFIIPAEHRHPYQEERAVTGALNHTEGKDLPVYFSSSLRCK